MSRVAIMQPTYMPWIGYFGMIASVDTFVLLDDVQLARRSWQVRNRIAGPDGGEPQMLSVPIRKTAHRDALTIAEARVADEETWRARHLAAIRARYRGAPFAGEAIALWERVLAHPSDRLVEINAAGIAAICDVLGIATPIRRSSDLLRDDPAVRTERLLRIALATGATTYVAAPGSTEYLVEDDAARLFADAGLAITLFAYEHPVWDQGGAPFVSHLGVLDLLAHCGADLAADLVRSGLRAPTRLAARASRDLVETL